MMTKKKSAGLILFILVVFRFKFPHQVFAQKVELINTFPSDPSAFTQGLELNPHNDELLIGTGLYGESRIGYIDLKTGHIYNDEELAEHYFGEGITVTPEYVWQLTWKAGEAFKRDPLTLNLIDTVDYEGEGWGLAYDVDRDVLWMSDGGALLEKRHPETFEVIDSFEVTDNNVAVDNLNELEYANGAIYANVWYSNQIIVINPESGEVEKTYDMSPIIETELSDQQLDDIDQLNGIAHIEDNRFYVTGKLYPVIFEVILN